MSIGTARARRRCAPPRRSLDKLPSRSPRADCFGLWGMERAGGTQLHAGGGSCLESLIVAQLVLDGTSNRSTEPRFLALPPQKQPIAPPPLSLLPSPVTSLACSQTTRRSTSRLNISLHHSLHRHQDSGASSSRSRWPTTVLSPTWTRSLSSPVRFGCLPLLPRPRSHPRPNTHSSASAAR
jgi:hypothetical protein